MIRVTNLSIQQGAFALRDVSFEITKGQYGVMMGPTGCGKTTVLECICGLRSFMTGSVTIGDRHVTTLKPAERGIGYVPQESALFDTMNVFNNIAFSLKVRGWSSSTIEKRVNEMASILGIEPLLQRGTQNLSGGERQRVALGRALAFSPETLLLDEPISALDEDTRFLMEDLLRSIQRQIGVTVLHVTHSGVEAKRMADVMIRLENHRTNVTEHESVEQTAHKKSGPTGSG